MRRVLIVVLAAVIAWAPVYAHAEAQAKPTRATEHARPASNATLLAMLGGGLVGIVLASGTVGIVQAGMVMAEGTAVLDALEAQAGLTLPLTMLGAILGAVFVPDMLSQVAPAHAAPAGDDHAPADPKRQPPDTKKRQH